MNTIKTFAAVTAIATTSTGELKRGVWTTKLNEVVENNNLNAVIDESGIAVYTLDGTEYPVPASVALAKALQPVVSQTGFKVADLVTELKLMSEGFLSPQQKAMSGAEVKEKGPVTANIRSVLTLEQYLKSNVTTASEVLDRNQLVIMLETLLKVRDVVAKEGDKLTIKKLVELLNSVDIAFSPLFPEKVIETAETMLENEQKAYSTLEALKKIDGFSDVTLVSGMVRFKATLAAIAVIDTILRENGLDSDNSVIDTSTLKQGFVSVTARFLPEEEA